MIKELILSGMLTMGDHVSTTEAKANGGIEVGPIAKRNYALSKGIQFSAMAAGGMLMKSKKHKIIYWSVMVVGNGVLIAHNMKVANAKH
jgi:hypothetical protein